MRFRPLRKPLYAPARARVTAALSLMMLLIAIALVSSGQITLRGALFSLAASAALGMIAIAFAVHGLTYIWNQGGKGAFDSALALLWALPVVIAVSGLTYVVTQTPTYPDLATNVNDPPHFEILGRDTDAGGLPLDIASPQERIRIRLDNPDLTTAYVERPGWHVAEVLEEFAAATGWDIVRLDTENGLTFEAEFSVPGELPLVQHDIALRIADDGQGSAIDGRALSSIPLHDFGTNGPVLASVLERFLRAVEAAPPPTADL